MREQGNVCLEKKMEERTIYYGSCKVLQFLQETYKEEQQDFHMVSADRLSLQRFDMEHHVNDRDSREVLKCAETI